MPEQLFRGYVNTTFGKLKEHYGKPKINNGKAEWIITIKEKEYAIYDYLPLESSRLIHRWRVDSEFKDLSDLEEHIKTF